jgi:hypothetical protein
VVIPLALIPNVAAALFNYIYNASQLMVKYPELWTHFERLSLVVNGVLFPTGVMLSLRQLQPVATALRRGAGGEPPSADALNSTWNMGHAVARISGSLWVIAGILFPLALLNMDSRFRWADAAQFFISLVISGGIAITYPFFGLSLLSVLIYFPRLIHRTMSDPGYAPRHVRMLGRCKWYLRIAAMTPLLALALLVLQRESSQALLLATIGTTALGLVLSFWAYQSIEKAARQMATILARARSLAGARNE